MALRKGAQSYRFGGGISTKADPKTVPPVQLLSLQNGVFSKGAVGGASIAKRYGYSDLSLAIDGSDDAITGLIRLGERDDELLGFTLEHCYSHHADADGSGDEKWSDVGAVMSLGGSDAPVVRTGTEQSAPDHATSHGTSVYAWEDSRGGVYYTVTDAASGRIHIAATQADASGISPRCEAAGALLHIYYANATLGRVYIIVVNPTAPSAPVTPAILVDDLSTTNPVYDACPTPRTNEPAMMAWHERGTSNFRLGFVDASGVLGSPALSWPSVITETGGMDTASPIAITYKIDDDTVTVCSRGSGAVNVKARHYDAVSLSGIASITVAAVTSPTQIAAAWAGDGLCWVAIEEAAAATSNRYCTINSVSLSAAGTLRVQRSVGLASRAWGVDGFTGAFAYFVHDTTYFNVYVALRLSDSLCVARTLPGLAADAPARRHLPSAHVDADVVRVALPYNERVRSANADQFTETGIRLVTLDFASEDSHQHAQLGRGLYLAGACPQHYDGRQWTEQGFHVGPELIATANGVDGSLSDESTYLYRAWYECPDAQGEIHRGPVSFGTLVTLATGEDEVDLTLPTLRLTQKPNARICVARSRAAETGSTAELFLVTSRDPSTDGDINGYIANDPTVDTVTFTDRMSDAVLATQEPLYTNGGVLSNDPCPLGGVIARGKSRLFTTSTDDPYTIRYSQQLEDGYAVEFAPELVIKVDPSGGPVSALADQDGDIIVWQATEIRTFSGDGPTVTGDSATSGFSEPRRITSTVGCTDPASIVQTDSGHIFATDKGLWGIDRSGQVSYVGAPAEAFNNQRTTSAHVLPGRTGIVFLTDDGTTLLYDYLFGQWSTFTNHAGYDAAVVDGVYHYLRTDGRVFRETVGSYSDAGQRITLRLETAWIHVAEALQGFQRFWNMLLLGTWLSPHQLAISHRVDYQSGLTEPYYVDATGETSSTGWITGTNADTIGEEPIAGTAYGDGIYGDGEYGGTASGIYQWRYYVGGRGQSVQFRLEDFERVGLTGASFELTEMLIEGGVAGPSVKPFTSARSA